MTLGTSVFQHSRQFLIAYVALVLLPLFGLGIVLKSRHALTAPPSLNGVWDLEFDATPLTAWPCPATLSPMQKSLVIFSQSGRTFSVAFKKSSQAGSGSIHGNALRASFQMPAQGHTEPACRGRQQLSLEAAIDLASDPRSFTGFLFFNDCSACQSIQFRAVRERGATE